MANAMEHGSKNELKSIGESEVHSEHDHEHSEHSVLEHVGNDDEAKVDVQNDEESTQGIDNANDQEEAKLMRTSINTAVAISLHNFPEGLATFVATLDNPQVGALLAIAIAIHNIPIGICVAMPVYYATGKRWKAFWWAVLSGATGPFSAFLGWLVLASVFSNIMYAILFGMVAGMLVVVSVRELLPTAHRYPDDSVVTYSFITGMAVMALSLVLFAI